jgi:hypothetical protein
VNTIRAKYILQGIAVSAIGAFAWEVFYFRRIYEGEHRFLVVLFSALFGLLMASIYLVPLGAGMGLLLPSIALHKPIALCVFAGVLTGIMIAGVSSLLVSAAFELALRSAFLSMSPVCSLSVVGWMLLLRRSR